MKKLKKIILIGLITFSFSNCTSLDDKVKEYREISEKIEKIQKEIINGTKNQEVGVKQMTELQLKLNSFDNEVSNQYSREKEINRKIEREKEKLKKQNRIDSIKQARVDKRKAYELKKYEEKIAREEESRLKAEKLKAKKEVEEMIRLEEMAERNAYIAELKEKGIFLVNFDGKTYEVNQKEWNDWKISEKYDSEKNLIETKNMVNAMGTAKANGLANSMYRTLSKGIAREGITFKAIQGIQVYDVITTGKSKFN